MDNDDLAADKHQWVKDTIGIDPQTYSADGDGDGGVQASAPAADPVSSTDTPPAAADPAPVTDPVSSTDTPPAAADPAPVTDPVSSTDTPPAAADPAPVTDPVSSTDTPPAAADLAPVSDPVSSTDTPPAAADPVPAADPVSSTDSPPAVANPVPISDPVSSTDPGPAVPLDAPTDSGQAQNDPPPPPDPASSTSQPANVPAPDPAAAPPASPPDGLLRQKRGGGVCWRPAPAVTWGTGAAPAAGGDWVSEQLTFYDLGPPDTPDPAGQACMFNGDPSTTDAVIAAMDTQATLSGYTLAAGVTQAAIDTIMKTRQASAAQGSQTVAVGPNFMSAGADLAKLPMAQLLDALQAARQSGDIEQMQTSDTTDRVKVAILAVEQRLDGDFQTLMQKLPDADQVTLRIYVTQRMDRDDLKPASPAGADPASLSPAQRIQADLDAGKAPSGDDIKQVGGLPMPAILDFMDGLVKSGQMGALGDAMTTGMSPRFELAYQAARKEFTQAWRDGVAALSSADDANALLARLPAGSDPDHSGPPNKAKNADPDTGAQVQEQYAMHWIIRHNKVEKSDTPVDDNVQVAATFTFYGHPEDKGGKEFQVTVNLTYNKTTKDITPSVTAQPQLTQIFKNYNLTVTEFVSVTVGVATNGGDKNGQAQLQSGVQSMFDFGAFQAGVQAGGTAQVQNGSPTDLSGGLTGVVTWGKPPPPPPKPQRPGPWIEDEDHPAKR